MIENKKVVVGNYFLLDLAYLFLYGYLTDFTCDKGKDYSIAHTTMQKVYRFWEKILISFYIINLKFLFDIIYPGFWATYSALPSFSMRRQIAVAAGIYIIL